MILFMSEPEQPQRPPIDPNLGLGEFLTTMQLFAGVSQSEVADELAVTQQSVSRWMRGTTSPQFDSGNASRIKQAFDLTDSELQGLIANNAPWEGHKTLAASATSRARRRLGTPGPSARGPEQDGSTETHATRMLGAFVIRAENGPPLNEVEAELVRFLIQSELEQGAKTSTE